MRSEAAATIFSRSKAPPPPLMRLSEGSISSAPSTVRSSRSMSSSVVSAMPHRSASARVASDVGTPMTRSPARTRSPSSSTKCFAVEPVPRPSFMPSRTCSSARAAACRFNPSMFTCKTTPQEIARNRRKPPAVRIADRATGDVRRRLSSVVLRSGIALSAAGNGDFGLTGSPCPWQMPVIPPCMIARRPIAIFDDLCPHRCIRSRRHARGYGARPDQRAQLRSRPRGPAPGAARIPRAT